MREYLLVLLVAAATALFLTGPARSIAIRVGAVAKVRDRDVHARPVPYFGGLAMLGGVAVAVVLASQLPFLGRHALVTHDSMVILGAGAIVCLVGVLDDVLELSALAKLAGQVLAAGFAVLNGVRMLWIPLPTAIVSLDDATSILVTVFFIVLCTNAINFVDGLDGLAAGVVAIGALAFFSYSYSLAVEQSLVRATTSSLVTVAVAGVCLGYLPHNFFPARIFMGDSGAMFLGLMLATSTISLTGQLDPAVLANSGGGILTAYLPILLPVATMALPIGDLIAAYVRRTVAGRWWFVADAGHIHHRLLQRGHSQPRAVLVMYGWTALISFGSIAIGIFQKAWVVGLVVAGVVIAVLATVIPGRRVPPEPPTAESVVETRRGE